MTDKFFIFQGECISPPPSSNITISKDDAVPHTVDEMIFVLNEVSSHRGVTPFHSYKCGYLESLVKRIVAEIPETQRQKFIDSEMKYLRGLLEEDKEKMHHG